jgi:AraC-like DNA-binding protein
VQSVANALGYDSASAFTTMFKKIMGASPKRYALRRDEGRTPGEGFPRPRNSKTRRIAMGA